MSSERQRFEFRMPDPGEGLTEAELSVWHVEVGEEVDEGSVLCEVETDKALVEIPIPCTGEVLELRAEPGDIVSVGDVIAVFNTANQPSTQSAGSDTDSDSSAESVEATDEDPSAESVGETDAEPSAAAEAETGPNRIFAAPSTRRYAREQGVDLAAVNGSGPEGRVVRSDIDTHVETETEPSDRMSEPTTKQVDEMDQASATTEETETEPSNRMSESATKRADETDQAPAPAEETEIGEDGEVVRRPLRGLRRKIADNMIESKRKIPHVTSGFKADAEELVALKERLDETIDAPITYTTLIMKAVVPALKEFPELNASIDDVTEEIVEKHYYNIGIATHTEQGLMVPVIDDVDRKPIADLGTELADIVERTRDRSVDIDELRGGTFTITNTGGISEHGTFGTPIIRYPEVAIMGVGRIQNEAVAVSDTETEVRKTVSLTLSYDHRLIDGVTATQFMEYVIEGIENPDVLMSRL